MFLCAVFAAAGVQASGLFPDGESAHSAALGGASVFGFASSIDALSSNPAALSLVVRPQAQFAGRYNWLEGEFQNSANDSATLSDHGGIPSGALGDSFGPLSLGIGFLPDAALRARWRYRDTPGGLDGGTSYGDREHFSELSLLRYALGASYAITPQFSLGGSVGLLSNRNRLKAPYIIQTQPQLAGAKTLLDMETDGWGCNAQFGALWRPREDVRVGLSYTLASRIRSHGRATSDAGLQLARLGLRDVDATTDFDAEVTNEFPQILSAGVAWQPVRQLELMAQVDWIDWSDSFDTLEVRLRNTDNALYRALLAGHRNLDDDVPLEWRDQWVIRTGAEFRVTRDLALRAGYRYARSPIPTETLTPMTSAIDEHVITAGLGYRRGPVTCDLAYQWHLPQRERITDTRLLSGEYRDSTIELSFHSLSLTVGVEF